MNDGMNQADEVAWNLACVFKYGTCNEDAIEELANSGLVLRTEEGIILTRKGDDFLFNEVYLAMDYLNRVEKYLTAICYDLSRFTITEDPSFASDMGATTAIAVQDRKSLGTVYLMVYSSTEKLRGMTVSVDRYVAITDSPDEDCSKGVRVFCLEIMLETLAEKLQKMLIWYAQSDDLTSSN